MLGRRGFLKTIGAAVLGLSLALKAPDRPMEVSFDFKPEPISDDVYDRYIRPAAQAMADEMDRRMMQRFARSGYRG